MRSCIIFNTVILLVTLSIIWCTKGCVENERLALLDFKKSFASFPHNNGKLSSWNMNSTKEAEDCCTWEGISCDDQTGHVVSLNLFSQDLESNHLRPSLLGLQYLTSLYLGGNILHMRIPEFIGSFSKLTDLDLSNSGFSTDNFQWLSRLSSIQSLDISSVNISEARDWLFVIPKLPFLSDFSCSLCYFPTPNSPSNNSSSSSSLQTLEISESIMSSSALSLLIDSSYSLSELHMGSLHLEGRFLNIFEHIGNLCNLNFLDASGCAITERIEDVFQALAGCASNSLANLFLDHNNLTGTIPPMLKFRSLQVLHLNDNLLQSFAPLPSTRPLFPATLSDLSLSMNNLNGIFSNEYFKNLSQLSGLAISNNPNLTFSFTEPPTELRELVLSSCHNLGPEFPSWVSSLNKLVNVDISQSKISGSIPAVFWSNLSPSLLYLNLSYNNIDGIVPNLPYQIQGISPFLITIDLRSNAFYGPIPILFFKANHLYLSENNFSGFAPLPYSNNFSQVPDFFATSILDISDNNLGGVIPNWFWLQIPFFYSLNLANNNLSGQLPTLTYPIISLYALNLSNNKLFGPLPLWLKNCTGLILLNLSGNRFSGLLPSWLSQSLESLIVLSLESNNFTGSLPSDFCHLSSLQILDLAHNKLSGNIPLCVDNLLAMTHHVNSSSEITLPGSQDVALSVPLEDVDFYSAFIKWKGVNRLFKKSLKWVKLIDLSDNRLSGEIPTELMSLVELDSLDLSSNEFHGNIPNQIGHLKSLEYLNMSRNKLSGPIPTSLSEISSLGVLDLSHNKLSGRIPKGTQLQSFEPSSFSDNPELCGLPLQVRCPGDGVDDSGGAKKASTTYGGDNEDNWLDKQGFYGGLGTGFAFGFLGILCTLTWMRKWRHVFFHFATQFGEWVLLIVALLSKKLGFK